MSEIEYRVGDATDVPFDKKVVIAHIVNNVGAFGRGFAQAVALKWPTARTDYLANFSWCRLGDVTLKDVEPDGSVIVANLFAQDGLPSATNRHPISYTSLHMALAELAATFADVPASDEDYEIWMPRIGTGYAGGDWAIIEQIIKDTLCAAGMQVIVFDLPEEN